MKMKKSTLTKKMDKFWADVVKKRDDYTCQVCRRKPKLKGCHAHHIIPKEFEELRHDSINGITLCSSCHKWNKYSAHLNAIWWTGWLIKNRKEVYEYLIQKCESLI